MQVMFLAEKWHYSRFMQKLSWDDIHRVVDSFYQKIARDPVLKHPFKPVEDWPLHIKGLTHFWWIRFGGVPYLDLRYDPVGKHYLAGFNSHFLERWLDIFQETLQKELTKEQAEFWYSMASSMGQALSRNNELMKIRNRPQEK